MAYKYKNLEYTQQTVILDKAIHNNSDGWYGVAVYGSVGRVAFMNGEVVNFASITFESGSTSIKGLIREIDVTDGYVLAYIG